MEPQRVSDVELEARFSALRDQRNDAMDRCALLIGEMATLKEKLGVAQRTIAELQSAKVKP